MSRYSSKASASSISAGESGPPRGVSSCVSNSDMVHLRRLPNVGPTLPGRCHRGPTIGVVGEFITVSRADVTLSTGREVRTSHLAASHTPAPAAVYVHGLGGSSLNWWLLMPQL